ncbi:unnamed protein product [Caenorhabditis bovis]|uniref:Uncharacterized protein n=1 Tax=Caenorhabditis bovis TaxID=2654633 RepID=A0A8S1EWB2_9PELO|nr:unnamed protein product [Caenorhabditis bovis]
MSKKSMTVAMETTTIMVNEPHEDCAKSIHVATDTQTLPSEECYDDLPKIDEVLRMPNEDIYLPNGYPTWMEYIEPNFDDVEGVEAPCPVGSEHIEMFHEKKFKMKFPPTGSIHLDESLPLATLMSRDETYFSSEIIFCNTLRSLINISGADYLKNDKNGMDMAEMKTQCEVDRNSITIIDPIFNLCYSYSASYLILLNVKRTGSREKIR